VAPAARSVDVVTEGWRLRARGALLLIGLTAAISASDDRASAGHELPFYPGYYPQEIRVETVAPGAAAPLLTKSALHAYVGDDPFAGRKVPANIGSADSLGGYVVVTLNAKSPALGSPERRCEAGAKVLNALVPVPGAWVPYPYPVTPFHADYLQHFDLVEKRRATIEGAGRGTLGGLKIRARGALAERLVGGAGKSGDAGWDALVEAVELDTLLAGARASLDGWLGPPWLKDGWFHAWLLLSNSSMAAAPSTRAAQEMYQRLTAGAGADLAEHMDFERQMVAQLLASCERLVAGYTVRRERFSSEFSEGVENVGHDSHTGFNSAVFVRTVKLKDFPWNGWLRLGIATKPAAAWNPIGGFGDPAGRLIWAAIGDPALLPSPGSASWVANRVTPSAVTMDQDVAIPEDALLPDGATGQFRPVGKGKSARAKITYRVAASAFHDNTRMGAADTVYPYLFAARWGAKRPGGSEYDPAVDLSTALLRQALAGFKVLRVDSEVKKFSDMTFTYVVPVVEVYVHPLSRDPQQVAAEAAPWSALPWHVLVLMEEAVKRGVGAFSAEEARRRGIRWLDLARDPKTRDALAALVDGFARQAYVPEGLKRLVSADEAQNRWAALRQYGQRRGHFLVTNGPYQLVKWTDSAVTLEVFRDFSNPLGVGGFDRFAIPRRAYVSRIAAQGDRLEIQADVERVEKFLREYRLVREPLATSGVDHADMPVCRFVVIGTDGAVAAAGTSETVQGGRLIVSLKGKLRPGSYTALVALALDDNWVTPEVATTQFRVEGAP
jgi:hypothetical protein